MTENVVVYTFLEAATNLRYQLQSMELYEPAAGEWSFEQFKDIVFSSKAPVVRTCFVFTPFVCLFLSLHFFLLSFVFDHLVSYVY